MHVIYNFTSILLNQILRLLQNEFNQGAAWPLVKATQDYDAKAENQLSFKAGTVIEVKVINQLDNNDSLAMQS